MDRRLPPPPPSREEVERKLLDLIAGRITREEASAWASPWAGAYESGIEDEALEDALQGLYLADGPTIDRPYLYERVDFEKWLADFHEKTSGESK